MVTTLKKAIAELATLPDSDQEEIGRKLLSHVEKLQKLRADIDAGLRSLDAGEGKPLDVEEFLDKLNRSYGRS
jgi:predicted transcriptional regulator